MNIFLSNEVIVALFLEAVLFMLAIFSLIGAVAILKKWDFHSTASTQYVLEKKTYLISTVIVFLIIAKILLLPFFAYLIDELSVLIPGAMCGAGVINANDYGMEVLVLKIAFIYLCGMWLLLNQKDLAAKNYPHTKMKFWFFLIIFLLFALELVLELLYFSNISTKEPVQCCSIIFGATLAQSRLPFGFETEQLLLVFYLLFVLIVSLNYLRNAFLSMTANLLFLYIAYFAVVYFFGTYIYELPTHQCPFCMLQKEYGYIGYFIYASLFLGTFFGIGSFFIKVLTKSASHKYFLYSTLFNAVFVTLCTYFPVSYYLRNGVWL